MGSIIFPCDLCVIEYVNSVVPVNDKKKKKSLISSTPNALSITLHKDE